MKHIVRRSLLAGAAGLALLAAGLPAAHAQSAGKMVLRISTPAVPDDWHA